MTGHLGLDDLAVLVGTNAPAADDHLAVCDICRNRLANLRARSADVSAALGTVGVSAATGASGGIDVAAMPADVTERISAALTAAGRARPVDISIARERRSRRVRSWLTAAAVVVVVGSGSGAIAHFAAGRSAESSTATSGAAAGAATRDQSLAVGVTANPSATRGVLLEASFARDAKAFVAQQQVKPPRAASQPLTGGGSSRCATAATDAAASTAGAKAAGGNTAPGSAALVGDVTVDGRPAVLYLVAVGPAKVAVALTGCSSTNPNVLARATL